MKEDKFDLTITNPVCQSIYQTISTIDEQIVANNDLEDLFGNSSNNWANLAFSNVDNKS